MRFGVTLAAVAAAGSLRAVEEPLCTEGNYCVDDVLSVRFQATGTSEIGDLRKGDEIRTRVTIDVVSQIAGFAYGLRHDPAFLEIPAPPAGDCEADPAKCNPTVMGTDPAVEGALNGGFVAFTKAETGDGFIQAVVLSLTKKKYLPVGSLDVPLCNIVYRATADPPPAGTKISFTSDLNPPQSPKTVITLVVSAKAMQPRTVNDAILTFGPSPEGFSRGDANGDGFLNIADAVTIAHNLFFGNLVSFDCRSMLDVDDNGVLDMADPIAFLTWKFLHGPRPPEPFGRCGYDPTADTLACRQPNCR